MRPSSASLNETELAGRASDLRRAPAPKSMPSCATIGRRRSPYRGAARRSGRRRRLAATSRIRGATTTPPISSPASGASAILRFRSRPIRRSIRISATPNVDLDMLQAKVDAGATRAITQFFFENDRLLCVISTRARARGIDIPIVPGIMPVQNFRQVASFAERCGTSVPDWLAERFDGLDDDPATRKLIAAAVAAEQVLDLVDARRHRIPLLHHESRRPRLRDLPSARRAPGGKGRRVMVSLARQLTMPGYAVPWSLVR